MTLSGQKCKVKAIFIPNYAPKLSIAFKMAHSCCFSKGGNSKFSRFPPQNVL